MKGKFYHQLYFYVLIAIIAGVLVGHFFPNTGKDLKILSDLFLRLIKMIIAPVIFLTIALGIASMKDFKKAGRVGLKTIIYFEVVTTLAMVIGLVVVNVIEPGKGLNKNPSQLDHTQITQYEQPSISLLDKIIPTNLIEPFLKLEILQVIFLALLTGAALAAMKESGRKIKHGMEMVIKLLFKIISIIMYLAPIGAFGGMAYTIGNFGIEALLPLGKLMMCVYITCILFIFIVLGSIAYKSGFSLIKFISYIKNEILIVLGTSTSESVLPSMMEKMEKIGCSKTVTGLVIPTGYSFNLDGTSIYLIMAAVFIAQATNTPLTMWDQIMLVGIFMLTSKGAAAVTGAGLVTLAASLSSFDSIPLVGLTLVIGIDRFMSEARAITNLIGNGVATVVISNWENETDREKLENELNSTNEIVTPEKA